MPRYQYDPSKAHGTIEIFPKDEYEFIVGEPKAFARTNKKNIETYGVRFPLTVAEGDMKDKRTVYTIYLHTEGGADMGKRFQMAVLGYDRSAQEEARFNVEQSDTTGGWDYDPETGAVGDKWRQFAGARVYGSLSIGKNPENGEPTQQFDSWRPRVSSREMVNA